MNKNMSLKQLDQEKLVQLMLSPFVHLFNIDENTKCFFNSLTLKKVYLTNEEFVKVLTDLSRGSQSDIVRNLVKLKFIVPQGFDQQKVFDTLASNLLRKRPLPNLAYVLVTDYCNFRCGYCFIENSLQGPSVSMSQDSADKVITVVINAAKNVKEFRVTFYGGEPLCNSEIVFYIIEKLEQVSKSKFLFSCVTNGSLVTEDIARKFREHNVTVGLSLDGWDDIDKNRVLTNGKETFYSAIKALSFLKEAGVNVGISCTITKQNYEYAEEIVEFVQKLGVRSIGFNLLTRIEGSSEYEVPDPKQLAHHLFRAYLKAKELRMFEDRIGNRRASYFFKEVFHLYDCPAFGQLIFFSPAGAVGPCHAFYPSGKYQIPIKDNLNVQEEPLFYKWFELGTLKNKECMSCPALGICGGACVYDVYVKTGQIGIKENYFCAFQNEILKLLLTYNFLMKSQNKPGRPEKVEKMAGIKRQRPTDRNRTAKKAQRNDNL
jgi:uncharacterized protein